MTGVGDFSGTATPGSYRVVRSVGASGSRVQEARHDRVGGRFAIKTFGDVEPRAFRRAAQAASALHHPGIVEVIDYGATTERAFVVMEWIEGRSLATILAEAGALDTGRVVKLVDSIALGLQAAHRQGLAHGRLAPQRVFVLAPAADDTSGLERTKIVGFGTDTTALDGRGAPRLAVQAPYTAPEQRAGLTDARSDQFALAVIAYEMLAGVPPFAAGAARLEPPSLREYDPRLNVLVDDVMKRALSTDPATRWPDIFTFSNKLREAMDSDGDFEERTRLAPLPLTRPAAIHVDVNLPVIASVDVDLGTPAPLAKQLPRLVPTSATPATLEGPPMNQPPIQLQRPPRGPSSSGRSPSPGQASNGQAPGHFPSRPHIQPTPTFSFTESPGAGQSWHQSPQAGVAKRRSGGAFGRLFVLMLIAGAGGYATVKYGAWQQLEPLVARATDLARSLRSLAPGASPELTSPTQTTTPTTPATEAPTAVATPMPPTMRPEVVPIAPPTSPTSAAASAHHSARPHRHHTQLPAQSGEAADESAAEEELLAPPRN